jgi:hypothetical protein
MKQAQQKHKKGSKNVEALRKKYLGTVKIVKKSPVLMLKSATQFTMNEERSNKPLSAKA